MMSYTLNGATKVCFLGMRYLPFLTQFLAKTFLPEVPQSFVKIISPKTWEVIDR